MPGADVGILPDLFFNVDDFIIFLSTFVFISMSSITFNVLCLPSLVCVLVFDWTVSDHRLSLVCVLVLDQTVSDHRLSLMCVLVPDWTVSAHRLSLVCVLVLDWTVSDH